MNGKLTKTLRITFTACVFVALIAGVVLLVTHPQWFKPAATEAEEKAPETEVPVKVTAAKRMTLRRWAEGAGYVEPQPPSKDGPAAAAAVAAPAPGIIAEVRCEPGKVVSPGDVLFQLDDRLARAAEDQARAVTTSAKASLAKLQAPPKPEQVALAKLAVAKAKGSLNFAGKVLERQQLLSKSESVSAKAIEAAQRDLEIGQNDVGVAEKQLALLQSPPTSEEVAELSAKVVEAEKTLAAARAQGSLLTIQAPLKATVVRVLVAKGEAVDPTKPLADLVALDRLVVNVAVPAEQLPRLRPEQRAEVLGNSPAHEPPEPAAPAAAKATVSAIGYAVDRKNNTVPVIVSLPADAGLRPGQFVRIRILTDEHANALAVPWASVVRAEEDKFAVSVVHDDKATRVPVTLGLRDGDWVEITGEGLKEGDSIVTEGASGLPKETKVHVAGAP